MTIMVCVLLTGFVSSCGDDDEGNENVNKSTIVGKWSYSGVETAEIKTNSKENDAKIEVAAKALIKDRFTGHWYSFMHDGTCSGGFMDETSGAGTYTYSDSQLTIKTEEEGREEESLSCKTYVHNTILTMERDYTEEYQHMATNADKLLELGIADPDFKVTKVLLKVLFKKD